MIDNLRFREILHEQLEEATNNLLPLVESMVVLREGQYGKEYEADALDQVIVELRKWQRGLLELFLSSLGESDSHTVRFKETISDTNFLQSYDAKRSLRRELMDSLTYVEAIIPYSDQIVLKSEKKETKIKEDRLDKTPKLFISHSSKDKLFVEELVTLLEFLGLKDDTMFCSTVEGYGIPLGNNIFDYLLSQFHEHELFVLFVHSPRYYESSVSLNEMGAAWALKQKYFSVLTKDMDFAKMTGVVTNQEIAIKVDTADAKLRMNELRNNLLAFFSLPSVNESRWETIRDKFIKIVTA